ncbi:MAG: N-acyl-D-amino-acid deacylase family protein [Chloroflexota bacterium]
MSTVDVLIRGGQVVDGSCNPWFNGDVTIDGDRIAEITPSGSIDPSSAGEVVDASGMVVSPGFIDIQSHSTYTLMRDPLCLSKITQGVTTEIMGESRTPAPVGGRVNEDLWPTFDLPQLEEWKAHARTWHSFRDWLEAMTNRGVSPNNGSYLGGGTVRLFAKGMDVGKPSRDELDLMQHVTREAMEGGAFGIAYALIYPPDAFAATNELVEMCKVVSEYGGSYITHLRSEGNTFLQALDEAIEVGQRASLPVEIYHLKASGRANWSKMQRAIQRINEARASGLDVTADMYPYIAGGTGLASVFPPWVAEGGNFFENLRNPEMRQRIKQETLNPSSNWEALGLLAGPEGVVPLEFNRPENRAYVGKSLAEIAAMRDQHWIDTAMDLMLSEGNIIETVYFMMSEENLKEQLRQPWIKISTDAGGVDPAWAEVLGPTHPRSYGTYTRILGKYVREEGVIPLEDAIRKMSSSVADRLGLRHRGLLREGFFADVVLFDPKTVGDVATFERSHQLSIGMQDVWVNGIRVVHNRIHTGATPGRIMNGPGHRAKVKSPA